MRIFAKFGEIIIRLFNLIGTIIIEITRIPQHIRGIDTGKVKEDISRIKKESKIEEKLSNIDVNKVKEKVSSVSKTGSTSEKTKTEPSKTNEVAEKIGFPALDKFSSKEKENTVLKLQLISGLFLVISILYIFRFLSLILYGLLAVLLIGLLWYLLYKKIKLMYAEDFNAYRDFFLMYVAVGIILVLVGNSASLTMAFPFQLMPSFTILIFAVILVTVVYLIFRIRYHRDFTYGQVIELGKNTAYVRVDYDIRSNVKPDIYVVETNNIDVKENEWVKVQIESGILSMNGNKPVKIIEKVSLS
ncbi:MAG: DUF2101 family protein [Methanobacteriaceae archaeon]|nr:DUF2101 family protein [Methanobacteriaceae archaeon]